MTQEREGEFELAHVVEALEREGSMIVELPIVETVGIEYNPFRDPRNGTFFIRESYDEVVGGEDDGQRFGQFLLVDFTKAEVRVYLSFTDPDVDGPPLQDLVDEGWRVIDTEDPHTFLALRARYPQSEK